MRNPSVSPSPQRSTLPPSWAPRRGMPESPMAPATRVSAVTRLHSGNLSSTAGSPLSSVHRHGGITAQTLDGRVRSVSPDRIRGGVVVHRSNVGAMRASSPVWQEDTSRLCHDLLDVVEGSLSRMHDTDNDPLQLEAGVEVCLGDHQLRCLNVLGSGSYSIVWRAEVLGCTNNAESTSNNCRGQGSRMLLEKEVALKDVLCRSNAVLRQSLFEVQLLLALERRVLLDVGPQPAYPLRLPRCFAYKVDSREEGWRVRTAMTRLPGEQLDDWLRRAAVKVIDNPDVAWTSQLQRGCVMAEALVRQIGPTLQRLAPLAWHRDVNSHNVLVSDGSTRKLLNESPKDTGSNAEFWLIDLGLAVDSRTWVSPDNSKGGTWRVTDIGGDCRYWPASSWMVHLYGADFLAEREDFCRQYQWRLDSFGLGITAVELICSTALAARLAGAPPVACDTVSEVCWARLLDAWQRYYDRAGNWWAEIYKVFSGGGDFRPVHAWLVEEKVADQVVGLMEDLREGLRSCMACAPDEASARILNIIAELIDESSDYDLQQLCQLFTVEDAQKPPVATATMPTVVAAPQAQVMVAAPVETSRGGPSASAPPKVPSSGRPSVFDGAAVTIVREEVAIAARVPEFAPMDATPAVTAASAVQVIAPPLAAQPVASVAPTGNSATADAIGVSPEEATSMATAAAAEGRQALAAVNPIPPIAAVEPSRQNLRKSRQAELAELVEAQAQLRQDLERLHFAKMRLQQARLVHESKKQSTCGNAVQGESAHLSNGVSAEPSATRGDRRSALENVPPSRGRSR